MILGITGTDGSGKGTVVDYLVTHKGFTQYSARAIFIEELHKRNLEPTRANMRLIANELRKDNGNDFVVTHYLAKVREEKPAYAIIESIRSIGEAEALKENGGILIAVDADQKLRFERVQARRSESDQVTLETFKEQEALEMNDPDPHGMQKQKVMEMADYAVMNNGTLEELHQKIEEVLADLENHK